MPGVARKAVVIPRVGSRVIAVRFLSCGTLPRFVVSKTLLSIQDLFCVRTRNVRNVRETSRVTRSPGHDTCLLVRDANRLLSFISPYMPSLSSAPLLRQDSHRVSMLYFRRNIEIPQNNIKNRKPSVEVVLHVLNHHHRREQF